MKSITATCLLLLAVVISAGCGAANSGDSVSANTPTSKGMKYLLSDEPTGAIGVTEAIDSAQDGEPVVVVGHIGGAANPWISGRAAFVLLDSSKVVVAEGQDSTAQELCTGDCCASERASCTTLVKVVDEAGNVVPLDAQHHLGLDPNDLVVVRGKAKKDEQGNFTILADALHVRQ